MEPWREELYHSELYHYGVLGMKWGIRNYQNADGSLTPAGKKRYYQGDMKRLGKYRNKANIARSKAKKLRNRVQSAEVKAQRRRAKAQDLNSRLLFTNDFAKHRATRKAVKAEKNLAKAMKAEYKNQRKYEKYRAKGEEFLEEVSRRYPNKGHQTLNYAADLHNSRASGVRNARNRGLGAKDNMADGYDGYISKREANSIIKSNAKNISQWNKTIRNLKDEDRAMGDNYNKNAIKEYQSAIKDLERETAYLKKHIDSYPDR